MTIILFKMHLTINFRNGFVFDIEATSSRPVLITEVNTGNEKFALLSGLVISLPFAVITYGEVYELEEY